MIKQYRTGMTPKWKFWLARLFGVKRVTEDSGIVLTFYYWSGQYWLLKEEFRGEK